MQKKKIQLIITGVLVIVLFFAAASGVKKAREAKSKSASIAAGAAGLGQDQSLKEKMSAEVKDGANQLLQKLEEETRGLELIRDPFVPAPVVPSKTIPSGLHLTGIVWDRENPKAIINEIITSVGDSLEGNSVVEIKQDRVILHDGIHYFELRLGQ